MSDDAGGFGSAANTKVLALQAVEQAMEARNRLPGPGTHTSEHQRCLWVLQEVTVLLLLAILGELEGRKT